MKRLLLALAFAVAGSAHAYTITGEVVALKDGDGIVILDRYKRQHTIRLMGVDAPERKQPFYSASNQHLGDAIFRRKVTVEWFKYDVYASKVTDPAKKRKVGRILLDGVDINLAQIKAGMAWHYAAYAHEQRPIDRARYAAAQVAAQAAQQGLWVDPDPIPPWVWRRTH